MSTSSTPPTGPAYGDSHEERVRELTETGSSVRHHGRGAFNDLRWALWPEIGYPPDGETEADMEAGQ